MPLPSSAQTMGRTTGRRPHPSPRVLDLDGHLCPKKMPAMAVDEEEERDEEEELPKRSPAKSTNSTKSKKKGNEEDDEDEEPRLKLSASNIKGLGKR